VRRIIAAVAKKYIKHRDRAVQAANIVPPTSDHRR
jgi:hypothetical protein